MGKLVGHNILGFDVPYLMRWSVLNDLRVPSNLTPFSREGRGRYFPDVWVDTMQIFGVGEYGYKKSLDSISRSLGFKGKNGNGKLFYQLNREQQCQYLANDIEQTMNIYRPMNFSFTICDEAMVTYFDIETEPKSLEEIEEIAPEFSPESVKLGNLRDKNKIEEKIENARENHIKNIMDKAGLMPEYSNPCAIGYFHAGDFDVTLDFADGDHVGLVEKFWKIADTVFGNMQHNNLK